MCQIFFKGLFFRAVSGSQRTRGKVQRVPVSPPPPPLPPAPQTVLRGDDEPASTRHSHPDPKPRACRRGCPVWGSDDSYPRVVGPRHCPASPLGSPCSSLPTPVPGKRGSLRRPHSWAFSRGSDSWTQTVWSRFARLPSPGSARPGLPRAARDLIARFSFAPTRVPCREGPGLGPPEGRLVASRLWQL